MRGLGAEKGQAGVAATEMEGGRAAVLGIGRLVMVRGGRDVGQVALSHQMGGILHDLESPGHHRQGKNQSTDLGTPEFHHG
jgi:hypothetical protein